MLFNSCVDIHIAEIFFNYLAYFRFYFCKLITKTAFLLFFYQYFSFSFQISKSFYYMPVNRQTTIFIEWEEFPKGGSPEFYFLKYQLLNNFAQKVIHRFFCL